MAGAAAKKIAKSLVVRLRSGKSAVPRSSLLRLRRHFRGGPLFLRMSGRHLGLVKLASFLVRHYVGRATGGTSQRGPGWATVAGRKNLSIKCFPGRRSTKTHSTSLTCDRVFVQSRTTYPRRARY